MASVKARWISVEDFNILLMDSIKNQNLNEVRTLISCLPANKQLSMWYKVMMYSPLEVYPKLTQETQKLEQRIITILELESLKCMSDYLTWLHDGNMPGEHFVSRTNLIQFIAAARYKRLDETVGILRCQSLGNQLILLVIASMALNDETFIAKMAGRVFVESANQTDQVSQCLIFEIFKGLYKFIADSQSQYMHSNVLVDDKSKHKHFHLEAVNRMVNSLALSGEQAIHVSSIAPLAIEKVIDFWTNMILSPEPCGRFPFAALDGSVEMLRLLADDKEYDTRKWSMICGLLGICISSHRPEKAMYIAKTVLEIIPDRHRQDACTSWLIDCACHIEVCGSDIVSTLLDCVPWNEEFAGVACSLFVSIWENSKNVTVLGKLMNKVPDNDKDLVVFLTHKFKMMNTKRMVSILETVNKSQGDLEIFQELFTSEHKQLLLAYAENSTANLTNEMLQLCQPYLKSFPISRSVTSKLQMQAILCFNDFHGHKEMQRGGASAEASAIGISLVRAGFNVHGYIKNWSIFDLFKTLRQICADIQNRSSLVVVCMMTHGKAGVLYGWDEQAKSTTDRCQINDIISILGEMLPHHVPKILMVQACQGLADTGMNLPHKSHRSLDALTETDARSSTTDNENFHIELTRKSPNTTLLMSTLYGGKAHRNHFISAMANEFAKADGERTVYDMFVSASHSMMGHPEANYRSQIPEFRSSNRQNLIIPKITL